VSRIFVSQANADGVSASELAVPFRQKQVEHFVIQEKFVPPDNTLLEHANVGHLFQVVDPIDMFLRYVDKISEYRHICTEPSG